MYKIVKERRAWWPVKFNGVTEEGRVLENEIELRFHIHGEDEHARLVAEAQLLPKRAEEIAREELGEGEFTEEMLAATKLSVLSRLYAEFTQQIAVDWRKVGGENGEPLRWEQDSIRALMNVPGVFKATLGAYLRCRLGEKEVRAGN